MGNKKSKPEKNEEKKTKVRLMGKYKLSEPLFRSENKAKDLIELIDKRFGLFLVHKKDTKKLNRKLQMIKQERRNHRRELKKYEKWLLEIRERLNLFEMPIRPSYVEWGNQWEAVMKTYRLLHEKVHKANLPEEGKQNFYRSYLNLYDENETRTEMKPLVEEDLKESVISKELW